MYISLQQTRESQFADQSQVFDKSSGDDHTDVDVVESEEEEDETLVDHMVNDDSIDHEHEQLTSSHVYYPPDHMTNLNLEYDKPSSYMFYNSYMQTDGALKVGDTFHTKEDCVRVIKKFHMEISMDYIIDCNNSGRYIIICRKKPMCMFWMTTSYRKRSDSWEISSIHTSYTSISTSTT